MHRVQHLTLSMLVPLALAGRDGVVVPAANVPRLRRLAVLREQAAYAWLPDALDDQHLAGGILWSSGDLIGLSVFGVLFVQWVRSSMREAEREDRRLDLLEARDR